MKNEFAIKIYNTIINYLQKSSGCPSTIDKTIEQWFDNVLKNNVTYLILSLDLLKILSPISISSGDKDTIIHLFDAIKEIENASADKKSSKMQELISYIQQLQSPCSDNLVSLLKNSIAPTPNTQKIIGSCSSSSFFTPQKSSAPQVPPRTKLRQLPTPPVQQPVKPKTPSVQTVKTQTTSTDTAYLPLPQDLQIFSKLYEELRKTEVRCSAFMNTCANYLENNKDQFISKLEAAEKTEEKCTKEEGIKNEDINKKCTFVINRLIAYFQTAGIDLFHQQHRRDSNWRPSYNCSAMIDDVFNIFTAGLEKFSALGNLMILCKKISTLVALCDTNGTMSTYFDYILRYLFEISNLLTEMDKAINNSASPMQIFEQTDKEKIKKALESIKGIAKAINIIMDDPTKPIVPIESKNDAKDKSPDPDLPTYQHLKKIGDLRVERAINPFFKVADKPSSTASSSSNSLR